MARRSNHTDRVPFAQGGGRVVRRWRSPNGPPWSRVLSAQNWQIRRGWRDVRWGTLVERGSAPAQRSRCTSGCGMSPNDTDNLSYCSPTQIPSPFSCVPHPAMPGVASPSHAIHCTSMALQGHPIAQQRSARTAAAAALRPSRPRCQEHAGGIVPIVVACEHHAEVLDMRAGDITPALARGTTTPEPSHRRRAGRSHRGPYAHGRLTHQGEPGSGGDSGMISAGTEADGMNQVVQTDETRSINLKSRDNEAGRSNVTLVAVHPTSS